MERVRFPLGTTQGNLTCFKELLQSRLTFSWPPLRAYSSSKISNVVSNDESNLGPDDNFVRFDARFDISVRHCIFDELELRSLRTSMCPVTTSFGSFDDKSFVETVSNDPYVIELLSKIEPRNRVDVVPTILNKAKKLLKTAGFFNFRYVRYDHSPLRVSSVLNSSDSFSNALDYIASQIADVYLEKRYVFPIERLYTGLFFDAVRTFVTSVLHVDKEKMKFHEDEGLLHVLTTLETLKRRQRKECLFLLLGDCKNPWLDKTTEDLNVLTMVKRNLLDCPESLLSERHKKQIRSALNFRAIHACLMSNEDLKIFGRSLGGYNLSLIANPFAVHYNDYAINETKHFEFKGKLQIIDDDCRESDFSNLRVVLENHVFKMALLKWHVYNYERTSSNMGDKEKTKLILDAIDYVKELNAFVRASNFADRIGSISLGSRMFRNVKKFLGLSIRGKKFLVVDVSISGFILKNNKLNAETK